MGSAEDALFRLKRWFCWLGVLSQPKASQDRGFISPITFWLEPSLSRLETERQQASCPSPAGSSQLACQLFFTDYTLTGQRRLTAYLAALVWQTSIMRARTGKGREQGTHERAFAIRFSCRTSWVCGEKTA